MSHCFSWLTAQCKGGNLARQRDRGAFSSDVFYIHHASSHTRCLWVSFPLIFFSFFIRVHGRLYLKTRTEKATYSWLNVSPAASSETSVDAAAAPSELRGVLKNNKEQLWGLLSVQKMFFLYPWPALARVCLALQCTAAHGGGCCTCWGFLLPPSGILKLLLTDSTGSEKRD